MPFRLLAPCLPHSFLLLSERSPFISAVFTRILLRVSPLVFSFYRCTVFTHLLPRASLPLVFLRVCIFILSSPSHSMIRSSVFVYLGQIIHMSVQFFILWAQMVGIHLSKRIPHSAHLQPHNTLGASHSPLRLTTGIRQPILVIMLLRSASKVSADVKSAFF